ncbi:MAG: DUF4190 domain-containing protein [Ilumatobacteraceae bacterium]
MSTPPPFPPDFTGDDWSSRGERPVESAFGNASQAPFLPPQQAAPPQPAPFSQPGPAAPYQQGQYGQQSQYPQYPQYGQQPQYPLQSQYPQQNASGQPVPYGYQQFGTVQSQRSQTNGMAVASMVLGIVGIFLFCFYAIPSILAVIFGGVALGQIKKDPKYTGRGMAISGLVTGLVGVALLAFLLAAGSGRLWF